MRLSLDWLKDFVSVTETPEKVAEIFTLLGFEVETVEQIGQEIESVIVAQILNIQPHPQADRLQLVEVTDGKNKLEVVCGAFNIKKGQKVPLACIGVKLPNGNIIKQVNIRGIESRGMLCSAKELGLGLDHSGIYILDSGLKLGSSLRTALGINDTVFDITISPNRTDCSSVLGLAREYASQTSRVLKTVNYPIKESAAKKSDGAINIKVNNSALCPKYTARLITDLKITESPNWLKRRLIAGGIRPINNIVDVTNYIMLETGQPLHAFDADKIARKGNKYQIIVRSGKEGENLKLLDGQQIKLKPEQLVIADLVKPLALAGVMGGADSEVTPNTTKVILEAAAFQPLSIRKTSRRLNLRSESSNRFERGIDLSQIEEASNHAASLMAKLGHGRVIKKLISQPVQKVNRPKSIKVTKDYLDQLLGIELPINQVKTILKRLGFKITGTARILNITTPAWRSDINYMADIVEEVGRLYGYNKMEPTYLTGILQPLKTDQRIYFIEQIRDELVRLGFTEMYNYSYYNEASAAKTYYSAALHYRITNPLNPEQAYLRTSLWPRFLENIRKNSDRYEQFKLFEIGRVFWPGEYQPEEKTLLGVANIIKKTQAQKMLLEIKGLLEHLTQYLNIPTRIDIKSIKSGQYELHWENIGKVGTLLIPDSGQLISLKLDRCVGYFEIQLDLLMKHSVGHKIFKPYSHYPQIIRDVAVGVNEGVTFNELTQHICEINSVTRNKTEPNGLIADIQVFGDAYRGVKIGHQKKSLPIRIIFQSDQRTLTNQEVDHIMNKIISSLQKNFQAVITGK